MSEAKSRMTCRTCGAPCTDEGACTHDAVHPHPEPHLGAGTPDTLLTDTQARLRRFLAGNDVFLDTEPMWMSAGIRINWGDLRVLAGYVGDEERQAADELTALGQEMRLQ